MKRFTIKSLMIWVFVSIGLCIGFTVLSIGQNATTESGSTNEFPWDVNQDRVVNVLDLVLVSQNFGTDNAVADVTGDGTVNVLDLVLVAQHFGETIPEPEIVESNPFSSDTSLILYFSFDELDGNQAIDYSHYQNHGVLVGNPQLVDGKFGKALEFNGITDTVEVPHHSSLTVSEAVTVMAWIHTPRFEYPGTNWQGILAKGNQHPRSYSFYTERGGTLQLSLSNGGAKFIVEVDGVPIANSADNIPSEGTFRLNEWQHVAARIADGERQFWINGKKAGTSDVLTPFPGLADTASVLIGNTHEVERNFLGLIDEVRIWNRALSEDEILEQMNKGLSSIE